MDKRDLKQVGSIFVRKPVAQVQDADEARDWAIEWQNWASEQDLSWYEVADWADYFTQLAKRFNLTDEFRENGII